MASSFCDYEPKQWQHFCEVMLRQHYGAPNFYPVPDQDSGDLGLEFFTVDGTLFQCYRPEPGVDMAQYRKKIQNKVNQDLKKLEKNKVEIQKLLDDIIVRQWVLLIPENKSRKLISYCNGKKRDVISKSIPFIDPTCFTVKIETADSYPAAQRYALNVEDTLVSIPILEIDDLTKNRWVSNNSEFLANIERKSNALLSAKEPRFNELVIKKYIQIDRFLDRLRNDHPDLHALIEGSARAQLDELETTACLNSDKWDREFLEKVIERNKEAFAKYAKHMSDENTQALSFGYLSKWLAECYLGFAQ